VLSWIVGLIVLNDFFVKTINPHFKKILAIYPHPDDEVFTVGGLVNRMSLDGVSTNLLCLTKGENYSQNPSQEIKDIRSKELQKSVKYLQFENVTHLDLGDGKLSANREETKSAIESHIEKLQPDLIITYDLSGFYGHPDHIAAAEIVTEICKKKHLKIWYSTMPSKVMKKIAVPDHMAEDKEYAKKRTTPTLKVYTGLVGSFRKIQALASHKSQVKHADKKNPLNKFLIWFGMLCFIFEYFYEVKTD
jgi:LmbE family N-acetylglucosaminyl deacetylase